MSALRSPSGDLAHSPRLSPDTTTIRLSSLSHSHPTSPTERVRYPCVELGYDPVDERVRLVDCVEGKRSLIVEFVADEAEFEMRHDGAGPDDRVGIVLKSGQRAFCAASGRS